MRYLLIAIFALPGSFLLAQDSLQLSYQEQWAQLESDLDSFSIFLAIDSLLSSDLNPPSEFNFRLSYNSNIASAGRNYGIDQHGFSPGLSYYHKSGFFADVAGFWNSDSDPNYSLTTASVGFLKTISEKWSIGADYERWFINGGSTTFENNLGVNTNYQVGPIDLALDYSYLFGKENGSRLIGNISSTIKLGQNFLGFKRISVTPTASFILGHDVVTTFTTSDNRNAVYLLQLVTLEPEERDLALQALVANGTITTQQAFRLRNRINNLTPQQEQRLLEAAFVASDNKEFGVLNYSFTLPLTLSNKRSFLMLSYTYSVPIALPGETASFDPIGFFALSFNYRLVTQ
ncbi:MAG: hypothetical protein R8G66_07350 [Cytophagales bacterium]|nr:hypothetical protein [Cytophagales bacterium]